MRAIKALSVLALAVVVLGAMACESATDKSKTDGVRLVVTDFNGLPVQVSLSLMTATNPPDLSLAAIGTITIASVILDVDGITGTSSLMDIELQSYEVIFSRIDGGTRTPPAYVRGIFGTVPAGGTTSITGLPVMGSEQIFNEPIEDLLYENGGIDPETGSTIITCNVQLRFFGRTMTGEAVDSNPVSFSMEIHP